MKSKQSCAGYSTRNTCMGPGFLVAEPNPADCFELEEDFSEKRGLGIRLYYSLSL